MPYSPMGAQPLGLAPLQPLRVYPWQAYVQPGDGHQPTWGMQRVAAPSTTLNGGALCYSFCCFPAIPSIWWGTQLWGLARVTQSLHIPYMGGKGSSFPGLVPSSDTVDSESVMGIKPGGSGVVIGYKVDEFTSTWPAEQFVAHSHICPGFTGKVSS